MHYKIYNFNSVNLGNTTVLNGIYRQSKMYKLQHTPKIYNNNLFYSKRNIPGLPTIPFWMMKTVVVSF